MAPSRFLWGSSGWWGGEKSRAVLGTTRELGRSKCPSGQAEGVRKPLSEDRLFSGKAVRPTPGMPSRC